MNNDATPYPTDAVTGVVLAGGQGSRMGGVDKGLVTLAGRPMASWAVAALSRQCSTVLVNANRNAPAYEALGCAVVADRLNGFAGPLAGIATALATARTRWVLFAPCDSPLVADTLGPRLWAGLQAAGTRIAVASDGDRHQPVFALMASALADEAHAALEAGERKIDRWYRQMGWTIVDCADIAWTFANVNRPEDREALESRLAASGPVDGRGSPDDDA